MIGLETLPPGRSRQLAGHGRLVLLAYGAMAALGVGLAVWQGRSPLDVWNYPEGSPVHWAARVRGGGVGLALGLALVVLSRLATSRLASFRWLERELSDRIGPLSSADCLRLAAASSLAEEILFRGALLPLCGLGWSSLIFALFHIGPQARYLAWTVSAFFAALLLGQLFRVSGDLTGPVLAHFTLNYLNLRHLGRPRATLQGALLP